MTNMSQDRIEKIGSQTLLDKQWADKPMNVIKNPHKLSEIELYKTLEKIVEMPEKRLKIMLKSNQRAVDEVFIGNIIQRIPQFLTTTLVQVTKTLLLQRDYFKDHLIWLPLEKELFKRRNSLNNEQLASVMHAFGVSGMGTKQFFYDLEETITDSPIGIETEFLEKILTGYSSIDQGTAVFYSHIVEKLLTRGIDKLSVDSMVEIAKNLSKSTNVHKNGYGFYEAMEKHIHQGLHEGRISFSELCKVAENILPVNIGTNKFHEELERFLLEKFNAENLQEFTDLVKGLSLYQLKNKELEVLIYKTLAINMNELTIKQLETLIWSFSRNQKSLYENKKNLKLQDLPEYQRLTIEKLIDRVRQKAPSMKPRGVAFAIESMQNLDYRNDEAYAKLDRVVLSKLDEFIPHYLVKIMQSYYKLGYGSGDFYDRVINKIVTFIYEEGGIKYSDMLRFFEIFPEVSYIYDNTMSEELYLAFIQKISEVIRDKKFPTEDLCRTFNILVRISPYEPAKIAKENTKFMAELLGRIRHSIYDIPKEHFASTLCNLIEFQQHEIAKKFVFIVQECSKLGKLNTEFENQSEKIQIFWSLMQIEKACEDKTIINEENLKFVNDIDVNTLSARNFHLFKQLLCLIQMYWEGKGQNLELINLDQIYKKILSDISAQKREEFINEEPATKSSQQLTSELQKYIKSSKLFKEIKLNLSDDLMTLINIACVSGSKKLNNKPEDIELTGFLVMNKHCYINTLAEDEPILKRSVDLKKDILEGLFGWNIILIDEEDFLRKSQPEREKQFKGILENLNQSEIVKSDIKDVDQSQISDQEDDDTPRKGGRKVKRTCSVKF
eukprot:403354650